MTLKERLEYADKKIDLACKEYEAPSVSYWKGYRDALRESFLIEPTAPRDWTPCAEGLNLPAEYEKIDKIYDPLTYAVTDFEYHMVSDLVAVTVEEENGNTICCSDLTVDGKWTIDCGEGYTVIAWQPLPAPYRADDTTGKPDHIVDTNKKMED